MKKIVMLVLLLSGVQSFALTAEKKSGAKLTTAVISDYKTKSECEAQEKRTCKNMGSLGWKAE